MVKAETTFDDIGLKVPRLLLPRDGTDLSRWAVVACDQYTSEPAYWARVKEFVGDKPSMLNLIYPEVYMPEKRDKEFIESIQKHMGEYMCSGILAEKEPGLVLIDRRTPAVASRKGLLVALDLEKYSFEQGSQSLIRATEKTIEARLPPRVAIREKASIESPHILVLIDDPDRTVIEPLFEKTGSMTKLYDFELMERSGHLTGHHVQSEEDIAHVVDALRKLGAKDRFQQKYGAADEQGVILFPVGDGNHSLATAKRCWEAHKAAGALETHPARYALVELNNVHDTGLEFHPIHRLLEHVDVEDLLADMKAFYEGQGLELTFEDGAALPEDGVEQPGGGHRFEFRSKNKSGIFTVLNPKLVLAVATLDSWLNPYVAAHSDPQLDYVHEVYTIAEKSKADDRTVGFLLPSMDKNDLVRTVVKEGVLPRKTFSMGHAPEKRFYLECRRILPEVGTPPTALPSKK